MFLDMDCMYPCTKYTVYNNSTLMQWWIQDCGEVRDHCGEMHPDQLYHPRNIKSSLKEHPVYYYIIYLDPRPKYKVAFGRCSICGPFITTPYTKYPLNLP